jgi:hypothetical protein
VQSRIRTLQVANKNEKIFKIPYCTYEKVLPITAKTGKRFLIPDFESQEFRNEKNKI